MCAKPGTGPLQSKSQPGFFLNLPERCAAIIDLIRDAPIKTDNSHGCPSFSFNKPPTMWDLAARRLFARNHFVFALGAILTTPLILNDPADVLSTIWP